MYVWVTLYVRDSVCACVCDSVCVWSTLYVCVCVRWSVGGTAGRGQSVTESDEI